MDRLEVLRVDLVPRDAVFAVEGDRVPELLVGSPRIRREESLLLGGAEGGRSPLRSREPERVSQIRATKA